MVSFTKVQKDKLKEILAKSKDEEAKEILKKIGSEKKLRYTYDKKDVRILLRKAFKEKRR